MTSTEIYDDVVFASIGDGSGTDTPIELTDGGHDFEIIAGDNITITRDVGAKSITITAPNFIQGAWANVLETGSETDVQNADADVTAIHWTGDNSLGVETDFPTTASEGRVLTVYNGSTGSVNFGSGYGSLPIETYRIFVFIDGAWRKPDF